MSSITKHTSIPKNVSSKDDLDFYFLRDKGVEYIEELGGELWTDLNSHDPGITILEMLSYAITDLSYRIDAPIKDLLTSEDASENIHHQFYKAEEVFPNNPVTELDYRKMFIDLKGVRNCWLRKYKKEVHVNCRDSELSYKKETFKDVDDTQLDDFTLKGLYTLLVEFEDYKQLDEEKKKEKIKEVKETIRAKYHANRNLCEDLVEIKEVEEQPISICANIEIEPEANEEEVHANVLFELHNYLSPTVSFHSLKEMLSRSYTPDEIFEGPLLEHGFIDTEELSEADLRKEVRLSDLMKIIMNIEGVKLIKDISIAHCDDNKEQKNEWLICIDPDKKPALCAKSKLNYHKGVLPLNLNDNEVAYYTRLLKEDALESKLMAKEDMKLEIPQGNHLQAHSYDTIQNDFPDTYGIGQEGLSAYATTQRRSQAKQLKSYLLFFDKILASYFQHLGKVRELLSINGNETRTYFAQELTNIKGFDDLVDDYPKNDEEALTSYLFERFDNSLERRHQILDHLLSRFAEKFGDYVFLMKMLYGNVAEEIALANKKAFLKDYVAISSQRGAAFNYYKQPKESLWDTDNISGFQKRVSRLLGLKDYTRRHLTSSFISIIKSKDDEGKDQYEWEITDGKTSVLLVSVKKYKSVALATQDLYNAVLLIIQTPEEKIEQKFENGTINDQIKTNIAPYEVTSGKYSFKIVDLLLPESHNKYELGKHNTSYDTLEDLKKAILDLINFIKCDFTEEGMFLVEHILLRPDVTNSLAKKEEFMPICADECDACSIDPYSFKVSIVLPGYTFRFSNPDFRHYMENIIREELPAHIIPRICWVGDRRGVVDDKDNDLWGFEYAYKAYLEAKTNLDQEQPIKGNNEHKKLIEAMTQLNTIYPEGRLLDCTDDSNDIEGRVILGQTNLGTLKIDSDGN
ncbi:hypothetical protein [Pseudotenacibaculum haliotis]|uniref:Uncharacterized protein n=1 Tax=Pseudotenacibaculum haliotis TaxID=1862138 RepID=A0ABW5LWY4_9FLAO